MGHTPGPWFAFDDGRTVGICVDGEPIAVAEVVDHGDMADAAQIRDDLHLIAAATELLAALERAIPHIGVGYSGIQRASVMKDVRAAIAKARGDDKSRAVSHYQEQARLAAKGEDRS